MSKLMVEIIQYTHAEMIVLNRHTGMEYSYFGCPRVAYERIKSLLAADRVKEAWQALKPYADSDRVKGTLDLQQG